MMMENRLVTYEAHALLIVVLAAVVLLGLKYFISLIVKHVEVYRCIIILSVVSMVERMYMDTQIFASKILKIFCA